MRKNIMLAMAFAACCGVALGQSWSEDGDAPALLPGQATTGPGEITSISGTLTDGTDVDLYAIIVTDAENFSAQTCGGTSIDSTLYLFDENGYGISMSEDGCGAQSSITAQFVTATGLYYIAMTAFDYDPQNDLAEDLWMDTPYGEERAPDGPGAAGALAGWAGSSGGNGAYTITLTGASFSEDGPPPPTGACCSDGVCEVMLPASCTMIGGVYQGDDTVCDPNPCPVPVTGACCFFTNGCLEVTESFCLGNGGTYKGDDSMCFPSPCSDDPPPGTNWEEDFDTYADGTLLYNVGGWSGWDDNPANAATVTAARYRSEPNSVEVSQVDAVHPFTGIDGGQWTLTAWQYIPSQLDATTFFVVNSYYEHGGPYFWTVEIQFNPTTGQLHDQLRDPNAENSLPIIYDQWVELRLEIDISGGLGTITQYYNGQVLVSGDWITGSVGQLAIGNVNLYGPHNAKVYYDDLVLEEDEGVQPGVPTRPLFAGVEYGSLPTRTSDLSGYPTTTWENGFVEAVSGAAGRPDGGVFIANGGFSSKLYVAPIFGPAIQLCQLEKEVSGLAYTGEVLYAYSNFGSPLGIYRVNPTTGEMVLALATGSYRFFALDYNQADGLLYGYTEYGSPSGLYAIDVHAGTMTHIANRPSVSNAAGRGMACGDNKVYVVSVYGDEVPMLVYDLSQGPGGEWEFMTHPFPESNSTSGAAWTAPWDMTEPCPYDFDGNGAIGPGDVGVVKNNFGCDINEPACAMFDLDENGAIGPGDVGVVKNNFGPCP